MTMLEEVYAARSSGGNDISELLPILRYFASHSDQVVEFGVRSGNSTVALLMGQPKRMLSIDLVCNGAADEIAAALAESKHPTKWRFRQADDREIDIPPTDLLFIDTEHTHDQLAAELRRHAAKVHRWIILHDTEIFGAELNPAIDEFLVANQEWREVMRLMNCNGLTVLERVE
jgi:hypothetical protein